LESDNIDMMNSYNHFSSLHPTMLDINRHDENIATRNLSGEYSNSRYNRFKPHCTVRSSKIKENDAQYTSTVRDKKSSILPPSNISLTSHEESAVSSMSSLTASFQESSPLSHAPIPSHVLFEIVKGVDELGSTKTKYYHMNCKKLVNNAMRDMNNDAQRKYRTSVLIGDTTRSSYLPQSVTHSLASYEESALTAVMNANRSMLRRYEHRYHPKSRISNSDKKPPMSLSSQESFSLSPASISSHESSKLAKEVNDLLDNVSQTSSREKEITNKLRLMKMKYYHMKCKQLVNKARVNLKEPKQFTDDMVKRRMNKNVLEINKESRKRWIGDTIKG